MKSKQTMALFLAAVSSAVVYSEAQAENLIQEEQYVVVPNFGDAAPATQRTVQTFATTDIPVVTTIEELKVIIKEQMNDLKGTFKVQYKGDTSNIGKEVIAAIEEVKDQDDYLLGITQSYGYKSYGYKNDLELTIDITYTTTPQQEQVVKSEVKRLVGELIRPSMSDVEKVKAINEYIVKNTTYSYTAKTSPHAAYAIVSEGKGVCQAYAMLAYMLLKEAGMDVHYVTGFAGEPHAWNLVKVDGEWYHLDSTWSDPTFSISDANLADYISYNYFLVSDQVISKDHKMDSRPGLPVATSERFSALRSDMSSLFGLNGIQYYLLPEYVDGYFYYVDYKSKSYPINRINLLAPVPTVEVFADVQAMDILAMDHAIYFVDVSMFGTDRVFGLSKIDLATKNVTQLYKEKMVTSIKKDSQFVYAYNGSKEVYREAITGQKPVEPKPPVHIEEIKQIKEIASTIVYLSKDFETLAQQLRIMMSGLGNNVDQLLDVALVEKINEIQQKYNKMKNLTFNQTTAWKENTQVTEAKKSWSVKLSQPIKNTQQNLKNIQVVDMFGDAVDVTVTIENGNTIRITPKSEYLAEIPYTLVISADLENDKGVKLNKGAHLTFTFK